MDPSRGGADVFGDAVHEGGDVVVGFLFDLGDAFDGELGAFLDGGEVFGGDDAFLGERFAGEDFDLEPEVEFVFLRPDLAHRLAAVAAYHGSIL